MLARIRNGVLQTVVSTSAALSTGVWVSNYDLLPTETLRAEGWKELEEIRPPLADRQRYEEVAIDEVEDKIIVTYAAVDIPKSEMEIALDRAFDTIAELDAAVVELAYQNVLLEMEV